MYTVFLIRDDRQHYRVGIKARLGVAPHCVDWRGSRGPFLNAGGACLCLMHLLYCVHVHTQPDMAD